MKTSDLLLLGALGVGAYYLLIKKDSGQNDDSSQDDGSSGETDGILSVIFSPSSATLEVDADKVSSGKSYTLPAGKYSWVASKSGYVTKSGTVSIKTGQTTKLSIELVSSSAESGDDDDSQNGGGSGEVNITVSKPVSSRENVYVGELAVISATVKNNSSFQITLSVKCDFYNSGMLWLAGALLQTSSKSLTLAAGESKTTSFTWRAIGSGYKDVGIEVSYGGTVIKSTQDDSVFKVSSEETEATKTYTVDLDVEPHTWCGWVTNITPAKDKYNYGDLITLEAHDAPFWVFDHWEKNGEWIDSNFYISTIIMSDSKIVAHYRSS